MTARRYVTVIQAPEGYPPPGDLEPEPSLGPPHPVFHTVVLADEYEKLEAKIEHSGADPIAVLEVIRQRIGGCREEVKGGGRCGAPADFVLWGKLIPPNGLGPRCYDHAAERVGHKALSKDSEYALIHLVALAREITGANAAPKGDD